MLAQTLQRDGGPDYHVDRRPPFRARNEAHDLGASFTPDGVVVRADAARRDFRLDLRGYGVTDDHLVPIAAAAWTTDGARVERIARIAIEARHGSSKRGSSKRGSTVRTSAAGAEETADAILTEWYINSPLGLEQGFTLHRAPIVDDAPRTSPSVVLDLRIAGAASASLMDDGRSVLFRGADDDVAMRYGHLDAWDATGRQLPARMSVEEADAQGIAVRLHVDTAGAQYPVTIDPLIQAQTLFASDGAPNDRFGIATAIEGDTILVGADKGPGSAGADQGAVYVFQRTGAIWVQQARLTASDGTDNEYFGTNLVLQGDTALIAADGHNGARGAVYVFTRSGGTWTEQGKLTASDGAPSDWFGFPLALDGDTALIGLGAGGGGKAYVFTRSGGVWTEQATLLSSDLAPGTDSFGTAVAIDGDTALVGASRTTGRSSATAGGAYVFTRTGATWTQRTKLVASDGADNDGFGFAVALKAGTAVIGARSAPGNNDADQGAVYVFTGAGATWTEQQKLTASDGAQNDSFGSAVLLRGDRIWVGAQDADIDGQQNQGAVYEFRRTGATWTEYAKVTGDSAAMDDNFGNYLAFGGGTLVVGASGTIGSPGAVYLFSSDAPPVLSNVGPQVTAEDVAVTASFTVTDAADPDSLTLTASSSNPALVPTDHMVFGGSGTSRTLTITPAADQSGTAIITITASDAFGSSNRTFTLFVVALNDAPSIAAIPDQTTPVSTPTAAIPATIADIDSPIGTVDVWARSSNPSLVPTDSIVIGGTGAARTITIAPAPNQAGVATITVFASDGVAIASQSFTLTVGSTPQTYYLAEGATGAFFDLDILLANPHAMPVAVTLRFLKEDGTAIDLAQTLAPTSRTTIAVDTIAGLESANVSTIVTSTTGLPIVVERTMRWNASGYGAHTEKATPGAAPTWYFAEGSQGFFSTYVLLANPHASANTAHVTYYREGEPALEREYPLPPSSRVTIEAAADPDLVNRSFGARVVFDQPGVAERAMYFGADPIWSGGHGSAGVTAPAADWFLAEGATGSYFTTFVLIANPNAEEASLDVTYFPATGLPVTKTHTLSGHGRLTLNIAEEDLALASAAVATHVHADRPVVVERAQYWPQPAWYEAHNAFGQTATGTKWGLAEGRVGGAEAYQTYILLANPGATPASVTLTFLRTNGATVTKTFDVAAMSRFNVAVAGPGSNVPELADEAFAVVLDATQPIVVERSMYSDANGVPWAAGTNATATRLP